jgi:hypothetical protein
MELRHLIAEAVALGGGNLCASGHEWESDGGRTCPKYEESNCSQTVYVCKRCGAHDYGDKGGPAYRECFTECKRDFSGHIEADSEFDKQADARYRAALSAKQEGHEA